MSDIIIYSGFQTINISGFSDNVKNKGEKLVNSHHVINVKEIFFKNISEITGHVIRQTSVTQNPYLVKFSVSF